MPSLIDTIFGTSQKQEEISRFTPEQQQVLEQMLQLVSGSGGLQAGLGNLLNILGGSDEAFSAFEAPIKRQFQEEIVPGLSEQFAGAGALDSSAFGHALGRASEGLSETLAAQRADLQQSSLQQLLELLGIGLQPQFDTAVTPGTPGILGSAVSGGLGAFGSYLGAKK